MKRDGHLIWQKITIKIVTQNFKENIHDQILPNVWNDLLSPLPSL